MHGPLRKAYKFRTNFKDIKKQVFTKVFSKSTANLNFLDYSGWPQFSHCRYYPSGYWTLGSALQSYSFCHYSRFRILYSHLWAVTSWCWAKTNHTQRFAKCPLRWPCLLLISTNSFYISKYSRSRVWNSFTWGTKTYTKRRSRGNYTWLTIYILINQSLFIT